MRLESGETIRVDGVVASNMDPRHLVLGLLGEDRVGSKIADELRRYEWGDSFFTIYTALDGPVEFRAGPEAGQAGYIQATGPSLDDLSGLSVSGSAVLQRVPELFEVCHKAGAPGKLGIPA